MKFHRPAIDICVTRGVRIKAGGSFAGNLGIEAGGPSMVDLDWGTLVDPDWGSLVDTDWGTLVDPD